MPVEITVRLLEQAMQKLGWSEVGCDGFGRRWGRGSS